MTVVTVLDAGQKKANREQEEPSKNLSRLCVTCLRTSPPGPAEAVSVPSAVPRSRLLKCIRTYCHQKKHKLFCLCFTVPAQAPVQVGILTMTPAGLHLPSSSTANDLHPSVSPSELPFSLKLSDLLSAPTTVVIEVDGPFIVLCAAP